jgi:uncharacterized protein (TIGR03000 family)
MLRKWFSLLGVPAIAIAATMMFVDTGRAQLRRYGGRGYYTGRGYYYDNGASYGGYRRGNYGYGGYYGRRWARRNYDYGYANYGPYFSGGTYLAPSGGYISTYPPESTAAAPGDRNAVLINVQVPAGAELWFQGTKTTQTGAMREFESPPLTPGRDYTYDIRARWMGDEGQVERTKHVTVRAGETVNVDFQKR